MERATRLQALNPAPSLKKKLWLEIMNAVNAVGEFRRDIKSTQHRYRDCKSELKKNMLRERQYNTGTGGGPEQTFVYSRWEEMLHPNISEVALVGIKGGIDTVNLHFSSAESEASEEETQQEHAPPSPRYESGSESETPPQEELEDNPAEDIPAPVPHAAAAPRAAAAARRATAPPRRTLPPEIPEVELMRVFLEEMQTSQRAQQEHTQFMTNAVNSLIEGQTNIVNVLNNIRQVLLEVTSRLYPEMGRAQEPGPSAPGPSDPGPSSPVPPPSPTLPGQSPITHSTPPPLLPQPSPMRTRRGHLATPEPQSHGKKGRRKKKLCLDIS